MNRFFVDKANIKEHTVCVTGDDAAHIVKSLRMSAGDLLEISDGCGRDYICRIENIQNNTVKTVIEDSFLCKNEPSVRVSLFVAVPKGDKITGVLQKSVELGVSRLVLFLSERCVARPDSVSWKSKYNRYIKIVEEAAKQCKRGILPELLGIKTYEEALALAGEADASFILYEKESIFSIKDGLSRFDGKSISLLTGPEGGFSPAEIDAAAVRGIKSVSMGRRIMRCETAPLAALCSVMYATDNFSCRV